VIGLDVQDAYRTQHEVLLKLAKAYADGWSTDGLIQFAREACQIQETVFSNKENFVPVVLNLAFDKFADGMLCIKAMEPLQRVFELEEHREWVLHNLAFLYQYAIPSLAEGLSQQQKDLFVERSKTLLEEAAASPHARVFSWMALANVLFHWFKTDELGNQWRSSSLGWTGFFQLHTMEPDDPDYQKLLSAERTVVKRCPEFPHFWHWVALGSVLKQCWDSIPQQFLDTMRAWIRYFEYQELRTAEAKKSYEFASVAEQMEKLTGKYRRRAPPLFWLALANTLNSFMGEFLKKMNSQNADKPL
jgi:hypothetical protein